MIERYTPKLHPSGHVDMVPDPDGEFVRHADIEPPVFVAKDEAIRAVFEQMNEWTAPPLPGWVDDLRWSRESELLRAKEGEE